MKGTIKAVAPRMKDGKQRSYGEGDRKTFYFDVTVTGEDGKEMKGEVGGKTEGSYRFGPGDEVDITSAQQTEYGWKFKFDKPKDGSGGYMGSKTNHAAPSSGGGWSKEKENSVMIQGLLKSVIENGMASTHWEEALRMALSIHDKLLSERAPAAKAPESSNGATTTSRGLEYHPQGHPNAPKVAHGEQVPDGPGEEVPF